jgi:hypothetical protein
MKLISALLLLCLSGVAAHAADAPQASDAVIETPQFAMRLQADNNFLPASIRWKGGDVELLMPQNGLSHEFISFEAREKIYHFENKYAYPGQTDPRFAADAGVLGGVETLERPGERGTTVHLQMPYATVQRTIWLGEAAPRLSIEYSFEFTRDVMLHETNNFHVELRPNERFDSATVLDARHDKAELLTASGLKNNIYTASLLNPGAELFSDRDGLGMLVESVVEGAEAEPPVKLLTLRRGQKLIIRLNLLVGRAELLQKQLQETFAAHTEYSRPFALLEVARLLEARNDLPEAQAALLLAADLNKEYAVPFGQLAGLRRDHKLPGQSWAWAQGAYRNPYNYGYMLSASNLPRDETLSEEQKRQHLFNILIAVENIPFYPDYYSWAARGFEEMAMYAQASAVYRQALWALDKAPYAPEKKARFAELFRRKLTELEAKMVGQTATALPPLLPVRPESVTGAERAAGE